MKKLLITLCILGLGFSVQAQKKKTTKPVTKKELLPPPPSRSIEDHYSVYEKAIDNENGEATFAWQPSQDSIFTENQVFEKTIELGLRIGMFKEKLVGEGTSVDYKKDETEHRLFKYYVKFRQGEVKFKDAIITFTDNNTKEVKRFKMTLDKAKKKIVQVQDLDTKEIYNPAPYEAPAPSIGF